MLEVENRIVVADGRLDEALRIPRCRGVDDLQARGVEEGRLRVLRMERPATHIPAAGAAHDDRRREAGAIAGRGHVVGEHVVGARDEVDELHLRDGPHSHVGRPGCRPNDRRFGDRRINHALLAEALGETLGDFEGTAVQPHVLSENEDALVALHLLPQPLPQRLQIGDFGHLETPEPEPRGGRRTCVHAGER